MLKKLVKGSMLHLASLHTTQKAKLEVIQQEYATNGEGVVLKRLDQPYMPGRQGKNFKVKLWMSATVRIAKKQKKTVHHSFGTEVLKDGKWIYTGSVTCKGSMPELGTYREAGHLYVGVGNHFVQPEDYGARTDVTDKDCGWDQLKLKQEKEHATR